MIRQVKSQWMMGAGLSLALWSALASALTEPAIKRLEVVTPRPFGYVIGDTFEHRIELEVASPYRLDQDTLPRAGRLNRWLELRPPIVRRYRRWKSTLYEINFVYQTFNVADVPVPVIVPAQSLTVTGDGDTVTVEVPAWRFRVAPISSANADASAFTLQPSIAPAAVPTAPRIQRMTLLSALLLVALASLAYLRWARLLIARRRRPFAVAYRRIRRLEHQPLDQANYQQALRQLHEAFNRTAGRAIFTNDLEAFFRKHRQFAAAQAPIEALFAHSRQVFFIGGDASADNSVVVGELARLCRECRALERRAA